MDRLTSKHQAMTFQAAELIHLRHPRSKFQLLTGTMQDCSFEYLTSAITNLKAGMSRLLREQKTLGWVSCVEITPSRSEALFVHPHIHALVWTPQFSSLKVDSHWIMLWQGIANLGADLLINTLSIETLPDSETGIEEARPDLGPEASEKLKTPLQKAVFYLHKRNPLCAG
jgi:hypothetical protein